MGGTTMMYTLVGADVESAYQLLLDGFRNPQDPSWDTTWDDPIEKPGFEMVWPTVVDPDDAEILARAFLNGNVKEDPYSRKHPNESKYGPWWVIQTTGAWLFFGWVNT